jgi:tetratricopeptide (TPR) repeat protein
MPRVYVSAVRRELGSFQSAVSDELLNLDVHPVVLNQYPADDSTAEEAARAKIESCDSVICLAGRSYVDEPRERSENQHRRSYAQLEYETAVKLSKPLDVFIANTDCPRDNADDPPEAAELLDTQLKHQKRLMADGRAWHLFTDREHLLVQLRDKLSERLKAIAERHRADEERQRADKERQRADGERQRAERAREQADNANRRASDAATRARLLLAILGVSLIGLITVAALAGVAFTQWRRADVSAAAAREHSQLALDTLHNVIFDMHPAMTNLPGSSPIHRRLLSTALERLERLSGQFVEQSTIDRGTAVALLEMGDLVLRYGESQSAGKSSSTAGANAAETGGATDSALQLFTRSNQIFESLANAAASDARAIRDMSISYGRLGAVHMKRGNVGKALECFQKGVVLCEAQADAENSGVQAKHDLSVSYNELGNAYLQTGQPRSAVETYQKDLELNSALSKADNNDARAARDLAVSFFKLGDALLQLQKTKEALEYYRKGLTLTQARAEASPNDSEAQRDLAAAYINTGDGYLALSSKDQALEHYERGWALLELVAKRKPYAWRTNREMARSFDHLGTAYRKLGKAGEALKLYQRGMEMGLARAEADTDDAGAAHDLSVYYDHIGAVYLQLGKPDKELEYYQKSVALRETRVAMDPNDAQAKSGLRYSYYSLAWLLATCWEDSIRDGKRAVEVATKLCELTGWTDPNSLSTLAAAYAEAGKLDDARKWVKEALRNASASSQEEIVWLNARMKDLESGKPFRQAKPEPGAKTSEREPPA